MPEALKVAAREIDTATRTLYGEARNQPILGQQAVSWIFRNRMLDGRWPKDLEGVCLQPAQFSCWLSGDVNRRQMLDLTTDNWLYEKLFEIVRGVMAGEVDDPTSGCVNYKVVGTFAKWAITKEGAVIPPYFTAGAHEFYRL